MWSDEEVEQAERRRRNVGPVSGTVAWDDQLRAIMAFAVELVAARGGTMTAEDLAFARGHLAEKRPAMTVQVFEHITAQGATVATLQAKAERLKAEFWEERSGRLSWERRAATHLQRAEAERLKAERDAALAVNAAREQSWSDVETRALLAESRLAAIRGRSMQVNALGIRVAAQVAQRAHRAAAHRPWTAAADAAVQWVLEDDAPREAKCPHDTKGGPCDDCAPHEGKDEKPACARFEHCEGGDHDPVCPVVRRYPCSPTCTHDDAVSPGHPERVKERSEAVVAELNRAAERSEDWRLGYADGVVATRAAFAGVVCDSPEEADAAAMGRSAGWNEGAEAMRAACWEALQPFMDKHGFSPSEREEAKAAIEGVAP